MIATFSQSAFGNRRRRRRAKANVAHPKWYFEHDFRNTASPNTECHDEAHTQYEITDNQLFTVDRSIKQRFIHPFRVPSWHTATAKWKWKILLILMKAEWQNRRRRRRTNTQTRTPKLWIVFNGFGTSTVFDFDLSQFMKPFTKNYGLHGDKSP